jgi:hypothetical protein
MQGSVCSTWCLQLHFREFGSHVRANKRQGDADNDNVLYSPLRNVTGKGQLQTGKSKRQVAFREGA